VTTPSSPGCRQAEGVADEVAQERACGKTVNRGNGRAHARMKAWTRIRTVHAPLRSRSDLWIRKEIVDDEDGRPSLPICRSSA